jgi:putative ABC transport system substrate-binding protein
MEQGAWSGKTLEESMRKRFFGLTLSPLLFALSSVGPLLLALCVSAEAQQPKISRIGFLSGAPLSSIQNRVNAFHQGLRDLGYVEGKTIAVEWRSADGKSERLRPLAQELVDLKVDVMVVAGGEPVAHAAKQTTQAIPIVMTNAFDPVGSGLVASLARPGGNITGLSTNPGPEIYGKQLELLKEAIPKHKRTGVLSNPVNPFSELAIKEIKATARTLGLSLQLSEARNPNELDTAFAVLTKGRVEAILEVQDPMFFGQRSQLAALEAKNRLPGMHTSLEYVEAGCLMAYAASRLYMFRRASTYVDKILKGTKPADLPVEQPTKFEFIINLKTAKQIGLIIPPNVLARADRVIR